MRIVLFKKIVIAMKRGERREERNKMQDKEVISNKITNHLLSDAQWRLLEYKLRLAAFFRLTN